jgi:lysozyme
VNAIDLALPLIKKWEGFSAKPYLCSAGVWTIGYGSTLLTDGTRVSANTPAISQAKATEMLEAEVARLHARFQRESTPARDAALVSFAYNIGLGALRSSTLWRLHRAGNYEAAAQEFPKWKFAGGRPLRGLLFRRIDEQRLYTSQVA